MARDRRSPALGLIQNAGNSARMSSTRRSDSSTWPFYHCWPRRREMISEYGPLDAKLLAFGQHPAVDQVHRHQRLLAFELGAHQLQVSGPGGDQRALAQ